MSGRATVLLLASIVLGFAAAVATAAEPPARELFGATSTPAPAQGARVIGTYAKGCLAGGVALPAEGSGWQAVRLSRNRTWGHPALIAFVERLAVAARADGWPGLLVGDLAQARGGPMISGHASHQVGLDVDLWLTPMPSRRLRVAERETFVPVSMLADGTRVADPARLTPAHVALIRRAARDPNVARIFVHPGIKQALCRVAGGDRSWLAKVRPWWGHDSHFHVRLACPPGEPLCRGQEAPPPGDGCGQDLAWWLGDEPWRPKPPGPPPKPVTLADLPAECAAVLRAP
ncbi:MAG TPA: penicillin-insensitive murein endopeptidase [Geminicoccaceae bacterium]|nr:penicillin-insensitive murein endopeptidase [Geminicoccaceae bacterium]